MTQTCYFFGGGAADGDGTMKPLLGGKGAGLAEMTKLGLPVPAGFTITTEVCAKFYELGRRWPEGLEGDVRAALDRLEKICGKRLGDPVDPLLVSVRSGAVVSMPGMMETILNLGLNDRSVEGLAKKTSNDRFAWDAYRRFIQMYSGVVLGLSKEVLESRLAALKQKLGAKHDAELPADALRGLVGEYKSAFRAQTGKDFPQDPWQQLVGAINAVFGSWMAEKAETYRRVEKISGLKGTAVSVVQMVFGNKGDSSGTGVCFTRDPNSGENTFYGDLLFNAQGEDVVAGIRTPMKLIELERRMPEVYRQLCDVRARLEKHYREMQDLEFTVEEGKLYMLQCRTGKRGPTAIFRIAVEMVAEGLITKADAVKRVKAEDIERLFYPVIDSKIAADERKKRLLATGINAVPGAATGKAVFTAATAEEWAAKGERVILVRAETSPEDVGGMHAAQGILTATGGKTSHAAVVARGWGKCCIVGCDAIDVESEHARMKVAGRTISQGDFLTLDGSTGEVYAGELPLVKPTLPPEFSTLLSWCDELRRLKVRTNADTPYDAKKGRELGAEGIGLCRTEHMFFDTEDRREAIQAMIVAETIEARRKALALLLPFQRADFAGIFEAMDGLPVTIRLIDPPLHEFVPHEAAQQADLARKLGISAEKVARRVEQLHESNPMLGHRGCRLCITYPEILEMQVRAIIEAAVDCRKRGIKAIPEIMHPIVMDAKELEILVAQTRAVADPIIAAAGVALPYTVGTMIELPRAALTADRIAKHAEFFSFGTNDLTQTTLGLSRDDAGRFLPAYCDPKGAAVFAVDPFQTLDRDGVGQLVKMGLERGRATKPDLKVGICGEHGGDPDSVAFCHEIGLSYVSCSPYRVPIARLAAAQAAIASGR